MTIPKIVLRVSLQSVALYLDRKGHVRAVEPDNQTNRADWMSRKITNADRIQPGDRARFRGRRGRYHYDAQSREAVTNVESLA